MEVTLGSVWRWSRLAPRCCCWPSSASRVGANRSASLQEQDKADRRAQSIATGTRAEICRPRLPVFADLRDAGPAASHGPVADELLHSRRSVDLAGVGVAVRID